MECYDHMGQDPDKCGYCELISEHDREISRLTAELEAEKAKRGAQLETIALWHDENVSHDQGGIDYSEAVGIPISNRAELVQSVKSHEYSARHVRALDPDATAALDRIVKQAVDNALDAAGNYMKLHYGIDAINHPIDRDRILARLDQRKEAGE